ncbi:hypothetical protein EXE48_12170 [Halorubrum sp. ASP1]|uniref:PH domain-containing protein n=1 Tax=Halorubrum sp. ASP1 TaxID=2518114 RepID=UPI0010F4B8BE|nr:PH domain-containing protein [Halorubrum sp. ASP1]TKX60720.1 hypothetical protein EXE48_12170 [Halorubrum sp. ASP1]
MEDSKNDTVASDDGKKADTANAEQLGSVIEQSTPNTDASSEQPTLGPDQPTTTTEDNAAFASPEESEPPDDVDVGNTSWFWPSDLADEDEIVEATNPHILRSVAPFSAGAMFLIFALYLFVLELTGRSDGFVNGFVPIVEVNAPGWFILIPVLSTLIGIGLIASEYIRRRLTWFIVAEDAIYIRRNILFRNVSDFTDSDITKIEQSDPWPLSRVGVGHILIYTASTDEWEARMEYAPNTSEIRKAIRESTDINADADD